MLTIIIKVHFLYYENFVKIVKKKTSITYVSAFLDVLPDRTTFSLSIPETSNEAGSILISLFRPDLATNISMSKYSASLSHSEEDNRLEDFQCNLLRGNYR